jgi:hypothetical protein
MLGFFSIIVDWADETVEASWSLAMCGVPEVEDDMKDALRGIKMHYPKIAAKTLALVFPLRNPVCTRPETFLVNKFNNATIRRRRPS